MESDEHIIQHGHLAEHLDVLEGPHQSQGGQALRRKPRDILPVQVDLAGSLGVEAGDDVEQGGLPRAVGADDAGNLPFRDAEGDLLQRRQAAENAG